MKQILILSLLVISLVPAGCGKPSAPKPAATADVAVMRVVESLQNDNPAGPWHMLPESYQTQLNDVLHLFANQMDEDIWDGATGVVDKLETVLREKKDLLLASQMVQGVPMGRDVEKNYDHLVRVLGILTDSELMSLQKLRTAHIGDMLSSTGAELMEAAGKMELSEEGPRPMGADRVMELPDKLKTVRAELVSEEGDTAVVRLTAEGEQPEEIEFVRVEGKWIPAELAEEFPGMIVEAKESISEIDFGGEMKSQAMMAITMANGVLDQIKAAETREDLQAVMRGLMGGMRR